MVTSIGESPPTPRQKIWSTPSHISLRNQFSNVYTSLSPTLCAKNTVPCENSCTKIIGGVHLVGKRLHIVCRKAKPSIKSIRRVAVRGNIHKERRRGGLVFQCKEECLLVLRMESSRHYILRTVFSSSIGVKLAFTHSRRRI